MNKEHTPKLNREEEKIRKEFNECVKHADELYHEVKNKANQTVYDAQANLKEYGDNLAHFVREKPLMSVLIAGGIGFIVSSLLKK